MIVVNPGYTAAIIQLGLIVLTASGWKEEVGGVLSAKKLILFLATGMLTAGVLIPLNETIIIVLCDVIYLAAASYALQVEEGQRARMRLVTASVLLIAWAGIMAFTQRWSTFILVAPAIDFALGAAVVTAVSVRGAMQQFAVLWLAVTTFGLWGQAMSHATPLRINDAAGHDVLWLSFLADRFLSSLLEWRPLRRIPTRFRNK